MKFDKCFLKISKEAELRISRSSLFHPFITDEKKKDFLKKLCLNLKEVVIWVSSSVYSTTTTWY